MGTEVVSTRGVKMLSFRADALSDALSAAAAWVKVHGSRGIHTGVMQYQDEMAFWDVTLLIGGK